MRTLRRKISRQVPRNIFMIMPDFLNHFSHCLSGCLASRSTVYMLHAKLCIMASLTYFGINYHISWPVAMIIF